jgi:hypothetical protein
MKNLLGIFLSSDRHHAGFGSGHRVGRRVETFTNDAAPSRLSQEFVAAGERLRTRARVVPASGGGKDNHCSQTGGSKKRTKRIEGLRD